MTTAIEQPYIKILPFAAVTKNYLKLMRHPLPTLLDLTKEYGADFGINFGFKKLFILGSAPAIKQVLVDNHSNYHKGTPYVQDMKPLLGNGLLTSEGEDWQYQRKILQPKFHYKHFAAMALPIEEQINNLFKQWDQNIKTGVGTVDIFKEMCNLTLNIITHILFADDMTQQQEQIYAAVTAFEQQVKPFHLRYLFNLSERSINFVHWRQRKKLAVISKIIENIMAKRMQCAKEQADLLDFMLMTKNSDSKGLSHQQILDNLITLFVGGHETTANSLAWAFTLLSKYPAVRAKLEEELATVLGDQPAGFQHIEQLPYTKMIIQETMRLYPPAYLLPRTAIKEDVINGHTIPAGSLVILNIYFSHYNPVHWENSLAFMPERFSAENMKKRPHICYLPFGAGPRVCLGQGFALVEAIMILARVVQRYKLDLLFNTDLSYHECITLRPRNALLMNLEVR